MKKKVFLEKDSKKLLFIVNPVAGRKAYKKYFPEMIQAFRGRIINIHPSLIPSFCGKGYYGLKVHEKALERGVKVTGATVHVVDEDLDHGPILLQKAVEVLPGDTPEILQRRVMEQAEWILLPAAIDGIANGRFGQN